MTEPASVPLRGWRYGMHPRAAGMQVLALGRVQLPLGEALRLELASEGTEAAEDLAHVQYYIATEVGPWALWLSCPRADLPGREAALQDLVHPLIDAP